MDAEGSLHQKPRESDMMDAEGSLHQKPRESDMMDAEGSLHQKPREASPKILSPLIWLGLRTQS